MPFSRACVAGVWFAVACSGAPRPGSSRPASHGGPWRELTSEHFTIWTDTSEERARVLVPTMENLRQVVIGVSSFNETKGKIIVVAFDTLDEVHEYIPAQFIAYAMSASSLVRQPVIVLAGESLDEDRGIVTHELAHVITYNVIHTQPPWFAEGIAGYFETVRLDEGRANLDIGVPDKGHLYVLHHEGITPTSQLFACDRYECEDDKFYATTWALFSYLLEEHPHELMQYIDRLAATPLHGKPPAWVDVVPSLPPETLDHELAGWLAYGKNRVLKYNIKLRAWPTTERPITEADVWAAKGMLRYLDKGDSVALPEIDKALELDPMNVLANLIEAGRQHDVAPTLARALTAAHPDDWRAWWLAWRASQTFTESSKAREKTCSLFAANPVAVPVEECSRPAPTGRTP